MEEQNCHRGVYETQEVTYRIANIPHVVLVERSRQDKKVVYSLLSNISEFIGHAICVLLDDSHEISLHLNSVCVWPGYSRISMGAVNPSGMGGNLVLMVCGSGDAMNYVPSVFTNLAVTHSDELLSSLRKFVQLALHCVRNLPLKFECAAVEFSPHC